MLYGIILLNKTMVVKLFFKNTKFSCVYVAVILKILMTWIVVMLSSGWGGRGESEGMSEEMDLFRDRLFKEHPGYMRLAEWIKMPYVTKLLRMSKETEPY